MSPRLAVVANRVSKSFLIYERPSDRLKAAILPKIARFFGISPRGYAHVFPALRPLSFEIARGETVGIIGRNGSGKSTLLQLICGTLTPTTGNIQVKGRVAGLLELGSGFNPEYSGRENIFLNAGIFGLTKEETEKKLNQILTFADIGEFIDQPVKTYSSGMAMRLAFSVIAHIDADVLVIDEAIAVGDAYFQQKCLRWLRSFQQRGTVLFCSHDPNMILSLCGRAIWLNRGEMRLMGPAPAVVEAYNSFNYAEAAGLPVEAVRFRDTDADAKADNAGFGTGQARIRSVVLALQVGEKLEFLCGGEAVRLRVAGRAEVDIDRVLVGFLFRDRLGLTVFGGNSHVTYQNMPVSVRAGEDFVSEFDFIFPQLRSGDYALTISIASGSQDDNVQHDWRHEAMIVKVQSSALDFGVIHVPMDNVVLRPEKTK